MAESTWWWLLTGALVALELLSGSFYLLMLALGAAAGALAAHLGLGLVGQMVTAAVVGGSAVAVWYKLHPSPSTAADMNLDVGEIVHVQQWRADGTTHIQYRGANWTATLPPEHLLNAAPGPYRIHAVVSNRLVLTPVQ